MLYFIFMDFVWFLLLTVIVSLNSINQLIFVMVKYGVLFEAWTDSLNIIQVSFSFKGLKHNYCPS
jgi:hypothetical protein